MFWCLLVCSHSVAGLIRLPVHYTQHSTYGCRAGTLRPWLAMLTATTVPYVLWCMFLQDIEAVLKHWASTFEIPETELHNRIMAAADGKLAKPGTTVSS